MAEGKAGSLHSNLYFQISFFRIKVSVMEGEENDIIQVMIIPSRALDNLFSLTRFRIVNWLIITSARISQSNGTNRALLGNYHDIIGSVIALNSVKQEFCDLCGGCFCKISLPQFPPTQCPPKKSATTQSSQDNS